MTLPIIGTEKSSGSPTGMSYYSQFSGTGCPRRSRLDKLTGNGYDVDAPFATDPLSIGAIFHKILEHYYKDGNVDNLVFDAENANVLEALRLFNEKTLDKSGEIKSLGYRHRFKPTEFGKVFTEFEFSLPSADILGVYPFTGKIDMVCQIGPEEIAKLQDYPRYLPISEPGVYLLDHKTMRAKPDGDNGHLEFIERFQFHAYMIAWNEVIGPKLGLGECKGFITNAIVKHKNLVDGSFFSLLGSYPNHDQKRALTHYLTECAKNMELKGKDYANNAVCFGRGRPCDHYLSGACKRY